jgi:hypothetical protein
LHSGQSPPNGKNRQYYDEKDKTKPAEIESQNGERGALTARICADLENIHD